MEKASRYTCRKAWTSRSFINYEIFSRQNLIMTHLPVLLHEAIDGLNIEPGDIFVDGTLGSGGHMKEMCKKFGNAVVMIGLDLDSEAISRASLRLEHFKCPVRYVEGSF